MLKFSELPWKKYKVVTLITTTFIVYLPCASIMQNILDTVCHLIFVMPYL